MSSGQNKQVRPVAPVAQQVRCQTLDLSIAGSSPGGTMAFFISPSTPIQSGVQTIFSFTLELRLTLPS